LRDSAEGVAASVLAAGGDLLEATPDDPLDQRDPDFIRRTLPLYRRVIDLYFRPQVRGLEHVPAEGPVLLVGNHSGGLYIVDTFAFAYAFASHFGPQREFHQLAHDVAVKLPALSSVLRKYGGVPASHECARRAFERDAAVLVYPGGLYETFRPSTHSSEVEFGGRKGFIRLALSAGVPIVPVVAIGGQETALFVARGERLAKLLGLDRLARIKVLPVQVGPPFGMTVLDLPGRIPLPSQLTIQVLPRLDLEQRFGPDPDVETVYEAITAEMQEALDRLAGERDLPLVGRAWSAETDTVPPLARRRAQDTNGRGGSRREAAQRQRAAR
jgi:1-acyl-sn-glycerol-3-phosphate acyltransferase